MFPPGAPINHMGCQTDPKITRAKTPPKKSTKCQTIKAKDAYKDDWEKSVVYRKALRGEADKRGVPFKDPVSDDDDNPLDTVGGESTTIQLERQAFEA